MIQVLTGLVETVEHLNGNQYGVYDIVRDCWFYTHQLGDRDRSYSESSLYATAPGT